MIRGLMGKTRQFSTTIGRLDFSFCVTVYMVYMTAFIVCVYIYFEILNGINTKMIYDKC